MITAARSNDLVIPETLRSCLENLRTIMSPRLISCFHTIDLYHGKIKFSWCIELVITLLSNFPRIRFLDEWVHTFEHPVSAHSAVAALDTWSPANIDNRALPRSVWQDLPAIRGHFPTCPH